MWPVLDIRVNDGNDLFVWDGRKYTRVENFLNAIPLGLTLHMALALRRALSTPAFLDIPPFCGVSDKPNTVSALHHSPSLVAAISTSAWM